MEVTRNGILLQAREIHRKFETAEGVLEVLQGVNLNVNRGDMVAVVGESGVGKSTLLHILGGLDRPSSGEISINNESLVSKSDLRGSLADAALGQEAVSQAPVDIVICAVYRRITGKYGQRGVRYAHIEVGHIAQNIHLEAVALGLGSVAIGAFEEEAVKRVLSLPAEHEPLYIIPVGYAE